MFETPATDDPKNPVDLGGLQIPTGTNPGVDSSAANTSASAEVVKKRRGRPPGSASGSAAKPAIGVPVISAAQFAQLYSPELWGKVLSVPADTAAFATGSEIWKISDKEKELMGATGSIAAQCFAVHDPRMLAVCLALITVIDVYAVRAMMYFAEKKKKEEAEKKNKT